MLLRLPQHILEDIVARAVARPAGPPAGLPAVLCVCRALYRALSGPAHDHLLARVFALTFDLAAPRRRLPPGYLTAQILADELKLRCCALRRLRARVKPPPPLDDAHDLWVAYVMLLEDDGRNARHLLEYADIRRCVIASFEHWLHALNPPAPTRWPPETPANALCAWILALTDSPATLAAESVDHKRAVWMFYLIYVYTVFMYPSTFGQWNIFDLPLPAGSPQVQGIAQVFLTPHPSATPRPLYASAKHVPAFFGLARRLAIPPLAHAAVFVLFARTNAPPSPDDGLSAEMYAAHAANWARGHTRFFALHGAGSARRDAEWARLVHCADLYSGPVPGLEPALAPGDLQGRWDGYYRMPDLLQYESLIQAQNAPPPAWLVRPDAHNPPRYFRQTAQWRLREFHCLAGSGHLPLAADPDWAIEAWFPPGWAYSFTPHGALRVWDPVRARHTLYVPHIPGRARAAVLDTIILGEPDPDWKALWGEYVVYGRVRAADGLVVLRRDCVPADAGLGRWLWYGYVHAATNWIGRFRSTGLAVGLVAWSGSFMMARSESDA